LGSLGFLNTKDCTIAFFKFGSDSVTFVNRLKTSNISIKNIPVAHVFVIP
jgi:hypothetical protein